MSEHDNSQPHDDQVAEWFSGAVPPALDTGFHQRVNSVTTRATRQRLALRITLAVALAILSVPLQDQLLALTAVLMTSLFTFDDNAGVIAQLLAPANTVAGLLSAVLFGLRLAHRRIFS